VRKHNDADDPYLQAARGIVCLNFSYFWMLLYASRFRSIKSGWLVQHNGEVTCNMPIDWSDCKTVLMPRQHLLKKLDPSGSLNVPQLREKLSPLVSDFEPQGCGPAGIGYKSGTRNLSQLPPDPLHV
jgi:hypothetical protein